jgi:hypothetical protein
MSRNSSIISPRQLRSSMTFSLRKSPRPAPVAAVKCRPTLALISAKNASRPVVFLDEDLAQDAMVTAEAGIGPNNHPRIPEDHLVVAVVVGNPLRVVSHLKVEGRDQGAKDQSAQEAVVKKIQQLPLKNTDR